MSRHCIEYDQFLCNTCTNRSAQASGQCCARWFFDQFGDKWTLPVLGALYYGPMRFCEMRKSLEPVSERMLIRALKKLTCFGLIDHSDPVESPHQGNYHLTADGQALLMELTDLHLWVLKNVPAVLAAYDTFHDRSDWTGPSNKRGHSPPENQL